SYWEFHKWSVENYTDFWGELWHYFGIISSRTYDKVFLKTGNGFLDHEWFSGATFNFAENILRIRDNRTALICADEFGNDEMVTFAEMFNEVKLYAAAFRKHGLRVGDRVACYMSNRKEAVFAMLATASIGAVWSGPLPYYGARAASNIVNMMEPKFLIAVDHFQDNGNQFHPIDNLSAIADSTPCLQKVIIIPTREDTFTRDLSDIRNSILLEDFLQTGRNPDGLVPDIVFEQLPFNHPICINFTSGTTGLPKGPVHSAGTLIPVLRDFAFHLNMKSGDIVFSLFPVGWSLWDYPISSLALGVKIFLYNGSPYYNRKGSNIWDIFSQYKVSFAFLATTMVDKLEKEKIAPTPGSNFDSLKVIGIGGSPVKRQNFEYLHSTVKKDLFVGSMYVHQMEELQDYLCVGQDGCDGDTRAVLFVKLKKGYTFTPQLREKIANLINRELWEDYVPQVIMEVPDIPYNLNNKRMESLVRRIVATNTVPEVMNIKNPDCLQHFCDIPELVNYKK
ncbi:acetoacetyl-CoA synthetase, partial [Nephila pilipes]